MSSKGGKKPSVPKFSSFKPKPVPVEQTEGPPTPAADPGLITRGSHLRAHRHRSHATEESRERDRGNHDSSTRQSNVSRRPGPSEDFKEGSFTIDKRGDPLIRKYGSNHRYDVPAYRRFGSGRLLGADGFLRIERLGNRDEFFIRGYYEGGSALRGDRKSVLARGIHNKSQPIRVRQESSQAPTLTEDFLPLKSSKKRKWPNDPSSESSGEEGQSYRSIHGKSKVHEHSESDELYGSDSSASSTGSDRRRFVDPVKAKEISLSARVRDHPEDIDAWLELVNHQNTLLRMRAADGQRATQAEIKSFADIKLSLLEKGLAHADSPEQRDKLLLRIMREGSKIWDRKTVIKRWEDLMKDHSANFALWKAYVNFRQTDLPTFRYDDIKQLYVNRLRSIETAMTQDTSNTQSQELYDQLVLVFLKATRFVADAGFVELAVAAWQAMLELLFCRPVTAPDASASTMIASFQNFWESEVPRIGEEFAKGWFTYEADGGKQDAPEPRSFGVGQTPNTRDAYKAWTATEQQRAANAKVPARTMDDGTEDDPYRVVMFADIQDFLVFIPEKNLPMIQTLMLDAYLIFCQLPPAVGTSKAVKVIMQDELLNSGRNSVFEVKEVTNSIAPGQQHMDEESTKTPDFAHDYQQMAISSETLFPPSKWFRCIQAMRGSTSDQHKLILNTLKQLARSFGREEIAPYSLAFDSLDETIDDKKTAKALLKKYSTNIGLYIGYANLENARGNRDTARNVLSAALSLPTNSTHDRLRLCIASAWIDLEDGNIPGSISRILMVATDASNETASSTTQLLKARQLLGSNRDYLISSGDSGTAAIYGEGLALLEYATQTSGKEPQSEGQGDIWSAMSCVSACSDDFSSRGLAESLSHERLLQFTARLLYHHATHGPFRPAFLRDQFAKFVHFFPQNTMFLSLYAWRETRLSIDDRVRSLLDQHVLVPPHDCVSSRVFAIRHEMKTGNSHSTCAAFEHALESDEETGCRHHPGLWISYMRFCRERKELRHKAKDVFYRAVQSYPGSREVFIEAFVTLVEEMDSAELKAVYNTLSEKGLRVHVELQEFVEGWESAQKQKMMGGGR
ncbi:NRDE-2, necessary for RNA interference-domain-containing protein [Pseudomassariella vexata]|uniref:NRDE-2, necessary for RNA interference-domain-containing protein n=1 Tax=Pseudomassariella vexata TaxID=1141098 RepID=A0A1Y2EDP7_9PEZI|nr:NRDE-2, necessary for RNA interference-domain-containing protein [Pseudomassariella vexata]ORY69680.1 NRDE-2, necessary for RNA interference-domain-containing protein [Pseudomassariella vexata]